MFSERDRLHGVSDNIMLGNMCPLGTGCFDLMLDDAKLQEAFDVQVGRGGWRSGRLGSWWLWQDAVALRCVVDGWGDAAKQGGGGGSSQRTWRGEGSTPRGVGRLAWRWW